MESRLPFMFFVVDGSIYSIYCSFLNTELNDWSLSIMDGCTIYPNIILDFALLFTVYDPPILNYIF